MSRSVTPLVTGETYHIMNRGVDKRSIFLDKGDYFRFHTGIQSFNAVEKTGSIFELNFKDDWLSKQEPLVAVHAYCLLRNHFHLIVTQLIDGGISEFMKRVSGGFTSYFNERYDRSGALFQGRFKRVHCETNEQLLYLAAYVNLNNIVHDRSEYCLSSVDAYLGKRDEPFVSRTIILDQHSSPQAFLENANHTVTGIRDKRNLDKKYKSASLLE